MKKSISISKKKHTPYIQPNSFFSAEDEKTKLNWILFEYALEIESQILRVKRLKRRLFEKGIKNSRIADFCVEFSKSMKPQILDKFEGRIKEVAIDGLNIEKIFPEMGENLTKQVLNIVVMAWDSQMEACWTCPEHCPSDWNARSSMFNDPYYYE